MALIVARSLESLRLANFLSYNFLSSTPDIPLLLQIVFTIFVAMQKLQPIRSSSQRRVLRVINRRRAKASRAIVTSALPARTVALHSAFPTKYTLGFRITHPISDRELDVIALVNLLLRLSQTNTRSYASNLPVDSLRHNVRTASIHVELIYPDG